MPTDYLDFADRMGDAYAALCKKIGPSIRTTATVLSKIYDAETAGRVINALDGFPTETFGQGRVRCQEPWVALQKHVIAIIRDGGVKQFEKLCSETKIRMREGAYITDDSDSMDHHKSGIMSVVAGTCDVVQFKKESLEGARRYLADQGVL
ncbi:MAG: hypothetical protein JXC85_04145 [Candidatus Aenigmarchaeota archaeon]|nr:hypothetical protein [Candidatus Aenigmarchaeota archaeon]